MSLVDGKDASPILGLRRLAMLVEYDGTAYHGFQAQANALSVQERLENAIHSLTGERIRVKGAGRTDAGVHAHGQVIAFDTWASFTPQVFVNGMNHCLPEDVSVRDAREVSLDFDPRKWAISREYRYQILNSSTASPLLRNVVHYIKQSLDEGAMQVAANLLEGERNFAPFSGPLSPPQTSTTRRMFKCAVVREGDMVFLDMVGSGFLPKQVRRTAGALVEVGLGKSSISEFEALADCGIIGAASWVLSAKGLSLMNVTYPVPVFPRQLQEPALLEANAI